MVIIRSDTEKKNVIQRNFGVDIDFCWLDFFRARVSLYHLQKYGRRSKYTTTKPIYSGILYFPLYLLCVCVSLNAHNFSSNKSLIPCFRFCSHNTHFSRRIESDQRQNRATEGKKLTTHIEKNKWFLHLIYSSSHNNQQDRQPCKRNYLQMN